VRKRQKACLLFLCAMAYVIESKENHDDRLECLPLHIPLEPHKVVGDLKEIEVDYVSEAELETTRYLLNLAIAKGRCHATRHPCSSLLSSDLPTSTLARDDLSTAQYLG